MKTILLGLIALSAASAFALPGDDELMTMINMGSKLVIQKDINILAHNDLFVKDGELFRDYSEIKGNVPSCRLKVMDSYGKGLNRDVVIRSGEKLVASWSASVWELGEMIDFNNSKGNILSIFCWKGMRYGRGQGIPTIGAVKKAFDGLATLELADPIEF